MPADHKEIAFEAAIEESLLTHGGFLKGDPEAFDRELALDRGELFAFLRDSQPKTWAKLEGLLGPQTEATVLDDLLGALADRGLLDVLRHGFKFYGKQLRRRLLHARPRPEPRDRRRCTRQNRLDRHPPGASSSPTSDELASTWCSSLNGLPGRHRRAEEPADRPERRARRSRSTRTTATRERPTLPVQEARARPLRRRPRPGLHDDPAGGQGRRVFLPFNRGDGDGGAGNPRTPERLQDRLPLGGGLAARQLPRHPRRASSTCRSRRRRSAARRSSSETHDLPALPPARLRCGSWRRRARGEGPGHNYLVQHSAGSGKSNSIAWLAHRLASLHDARRREGLRLGRRRHRPARARPAAPGHDLPVRAQAGRRADDRRELARSSPRRSTTGTPIVITTLQKFPFVTEKIGQLPERRYAVIVDEAHSSQTRRERHGS